MKYPHRFQLLAVLLAALLSAGARGQATEGTYQEIRPAQPTQAADKIEVLEFFWYFCPHCYAFESYLEKWLATKPADVEFVRVPCTFHSGCVITARAFYVEQKLGLVDKLHRPLFDAAHQHGEMFRSEDDFRDFLKDFFVSHGVDGDQYAQIYDSAETRIRVRQAEVLAQNYKILGVPTVTVNGKYLTTATMAGSYENLMKVVDDLVNRERKALGH
jgi:protein dithiol oxidoreductase (disulfide-forming)